MGTKIMYCPGCERKLEIKENTRLDGMKCPLCNEAFLLPAEGEASDPDKQLNELFQKVDYENRAMMNHPKIDGLYYYRNHDNFHLGERKN